MVQAMDALEPLRSQASPRPPLPSLCARGQPGCSRARPELADPAAQLRLRFGPGTRPKPHRAYRALFVSEFAQSFASPAAARANRAKDCTRTAPALKSCAEAWPF